MGDRSDHIERKSEYPFKDFDFNDRVLSLAIIRDSKDSDESGEGFIFKTLNISSHILALKSCFFYKLFKSGMRESQHENVVSMTIDEYEEAALVDLINFMYYNTLIASSRDEMIEVLIMADKLEVPSCIIYCVHKLLEFPMSQESLIVHFNIPSCVLVNELVHPLHDASIKYLLKHYNHFTKMWPEAKKWPLPMLETILKSEGLQATSEDDVLDFILKWGIASYPDPKERREIITKHLAQFLSFKDLSPSKLREILESESFDQNRVSKLVQEALFYKVERQQVNIVNVINKHKIRISDGLQPLQRRVYSAPYCEIYYDLNKEDLARLYASKSRCSMPFNLDGNLLNLNIECIPFLNLYVGSLQTSYVVHETPTIDVQVAVKNKKRSMEFEIKSNHTKLRWDRLGIYLPTTIDFLGISMYRLLNHDDNGYLIDDVLHLRVRVTVNNS